MSEHGMRPCDRSFLGDEIGGVYLVANEDTSDPVENFYKRIEAEKKLRDVIAGITAKLGRSNLSAEEGKRHAEALVDAYKALEKMDVYGLLRELAK
jgi:hypothetical protein